MSIQSLISEDEVTLMHRYICEGVGDPKRLRLLYLVAERPRNVTELTELLDVTQPTVSHHLRILRERGLVNAERDGTSIYYSLGDPRILEAMNILRSFVADKIQEAGSKMQDAGGKMQDAGGKMQDA